MSLIENKSERLLDEQIRKAIAVASSHVSVKASLGTVASNVTFDPNALDGDGDGMVQDGSPFERPAVIGAIKTTAQRLGNILARATRVNREGRVTEYQRRYSGMSAKDIAEQVVPDSFESWVALTYERMRVENPSLPDFSGDPTPEQITEMANALEQFVRSDMLWMLSPERADEFKRLEKEDPDKAFSYLIDGIFDFSPQAVAKNRRLVEHVLTTNPQFRTLVDKYGMPPIVKFGPNMWEGNNASGMHANTLGIMLQELGNVKSKGKGNFISRNINWSWLSDSMFPNKVGSKRTKRWTSRTSPEALLVHEYGHYLSLAIGERLTPEDRDNNTPRMKAWRFSARSSWSDAFSDLGRDDWYEGYKFGEDGKRRKIDPEIPHVETAYGESSPIETWAESISALIAHDGDESDLVSDGMKRLVAEGLGLDPEKDIHEQLTPSRMARQIVPDGFASRGSVMAIDSERSAQFGELNDTPSLVNEWVGKPGDNGGLTELLIIEEGIDVHYDSDNTVELEQFINENPAVGEMIRRHGAAPIYFTSEDNEGLQNEAGITLTSVSPPASAIVIVDYETLWGNDTVSEQVSEQRVAKWKAPKTVTRLLVSESVESTIRHELGHSIHSRLVERVNNGEITGRRAQLIRAYNADTWEEFYKEIGRPDLLEDHLNGKLSPEQPFVDSAYGHIRPNEMLAEMFTAYTSSEPEFRGLLNDVALDHLQSMFGNTDPIQQSLPDVEDEITPDPALSVDGFASRGPVKSYSELRKERLGKGEGPFSRSEMFRNTTTEEKVELAVPTDEITYAQMAWDQVFERLGLSYKDASRIDVTDPFNPKIPRRWAAIQDTLDQYVQLMQFNMPDFSPESVQRNKEALQAALDAFPRLRELSDRMGIPPLVTMNEATRRRIIHQMVMKEAFDKLRRGQDKSLPGEVIDAIPGYMDYSNGQTSWDEFLAAPTSKRLIDYFGKMDESGQMEKLMSGVGGGFSPSLEIFMMPRNMGEAFADGRRVNLGHIPKPGDWAMTDNSYEGVLLHEYGHFIHNRVIARSKRGDSDALRLVKEHANLYQDKDAHIETEYAKTVAEEFAAETLAAVMSGSRDAEELLSKEARRWAREAAGLPANDPVFTGRVNASRKPPTIFDRFGNRWRKSPDGTWESRLPGAARQAEGVPDVLETMVEAKQRTGLRSLDPVSFDHDGRKFSIRQLGDTFEIDINSRTVATASVVEGADGLPEIRNVDVLPGYEGIAPDKDLHEMIVDHARKQYPSARAPRRTQKAAVVSEGFASRGPEHADLTGLEGTPGTPEYVANLGAEFEKAKADGKRVHFMYNGELREVEVTEVFEKDGNLYMKGNDALREGAERMFRIDRVSMPKIVKNPDTGKSEVIKPGKKPRRPVPVFTGKAAEIFEGANSWEEVAERLGKGRYVFFDFETTGIEENDLDTEYLHPGTPVQIGLVEIVDGQVTRRWSTHVNPGRPMSVDPKTGRSWSADNLKYMDPDTGELMPLTDEWLAQQKPLGEALEEMLEFIDPMDETILGGQNHPYDDDVMKRALQDAGIDPARWSPGGFIDSQALAQSLLDKDSDDYPRDPVKGYKTVSLGPLAAFLGHDMGDGWHSADADSEASWEAFRRLVERAARHEAEGKPVRRDLLTPGGGEKEYSERLGSFERQRNAWISKRRQQVEAEKAAASQEPEGLASRGTTGAPKQRAADPARWDQLTPEQRDAATQASAAAAVDYINALADAGIDVNALRDLDRAELDAILQDLVPGGEARVSDYVTGDGKALIEVSNATMGKAFMAMGFHVQVISDDPNEHHLLENGINDMQKALKDYVNAVAKDPDALLKDAVFRDWANKNGVDLDNLSDKKLEKAAKNFAEQFEINLCLYYKAGSNMLCGENIGIEREEMPQLGGRMKGDDTLAARAIKSGLMAAKEFKLDKDKFDKLDPEKQKQLQALAKDPAKVAELAKSRDPLAKELFDVLDWNDTEANVESIADQAAAALGIVVDKPRFVDPATMLGAQNQLQGSKVENMADGAVKAVLEALPILEARFGRKPTQAELMDYLANEIKHGLFQPTLTAGHPGSQIYMLDGHHRWSGLLMANKKLEAMGLDVRVQLSIKNYQTDIRSGLELGRAVQVAMGVKDAKLAGEDPFKFNADAPELTPDEFDSVIKDLVDPASMKKRLEEIRQGGKFRATQDFDELGQATRLNPRRRPIADVVTELTSKGQSLDPQSRVEGIKAQPVGYRAAGTGSGWQSVENHIAIETERGNPLFDSYQEYLDKGYEVAWVTHTPGEAGRYVVNAGDVDAWKAGEVEVDPANIDSVDLMGATLVAKDDEGGYLYARRKPTPALSRRMQSVREEERLIDAYESGSFGLASRSMPLDMTDVFPGSGRPIPGIKPRDPMFGALDNESTKKLRADVAAERIKKYLQASGFITSNDERDIEEALQQMESMGDYGKKKAAQLRKQFEQAKNARDKWRQEALDRVRDMPLPDRYVKPQALLRQGGSRKPLVDDDWATQYEIQKRYKQKEWRNVDSLGAPLPGEPIYRESIKIGGRQYTFEADSDGMITVYKGRRDIARLVLDRGFSQINGRREPNPKRHYIDYVGVSRRHRRRGIATEMARVAEHVYGGRVEHSAVLTEAGRAWRDADMAERGAPGAALPDETVNAMMRIPVDGFASRGPAMPEAKPAPKQPQIQRVQETIEDYGPPLTVFEQDLISRITSMGPETVMRTGLNGDQVRDVFDRISVSVQKHVNKYMTDKNTREKVRHGLKLIGQIGKLWANHRFGLVPGIAGKLTSSEHDVVGFANAMIGAGIHEALAAYGEHYARLIATELVAMGIATRQKAKEMIEEIKQRMERGGEYIGTMSRESWNRLRGAWAKIRPTAPIQAAGAKQWIVAGSTAAWAEMSWDSYSTKSRITQHLAPSQTRQWHDLATKVGPSPELIDIAAYRAGIGYGRRRVKSRDVVRVYL